MRLDVITLIAATSDSNIVQTSLKASSFLCVQGGIFGVYLMDVRQWIQRNENCRQNQLHYALNTTFFGLFFMTLYVCAGILKPSAQMTAKTEQSSGKMRAKNASFYPRIEEQR